MRKLGRELTAAALLMSVFGCSHPEDFRWSGTAQFIVDPSVEAVIATFNNPNDPSRVDLSQPHVAVYSYPSISEEKKPPTIRDFSDRAQATLIDRLTRKGAKPEEIREALAKPIAAAAASAEPVIPNRDLFEFDRNLVATVTKGFSAAPGDRLMWTWILIRPRNFEFEGYTVAATRNQTLDIEHIQHTTSTDLEGKISATVPGPGSIAPSLSGSVKDERVSSADIKQQYEELSVDITPGFLRIYRESERNLDVAGNTIISTKLVANPDRLPAGSSAGPLLDTVSRVARLKILGDKGLLAPAEATLEVEQIRRPLHCPLYADVMMIYQYRRVKPGDRKNYIEGDQKVTIEQRMMPWRLTMLVNADEVAPPLYGVIDDRSIPVQAMVIAEGRARDLAFSDYETAQSFAHWLSLKRPTQVGKSVQLVAYGQGLHADRLARRDVSDSICQALPVKREPEPIPFLQSR